LSSEPSTFLSEDKSIFSFFRFVPPFLLLPISSSVSSSFLYHFTFNLCVYRQSIFTVLRTASAMCFTTEGYYHNCFFLRVFHEWLSKPWPLPPQIREISLPATSTSPTTKGSWITTSATNLRIEI
jgi:hypothetical protein